MIELPEKFKRDVESKVTNLIPLVVIDDRIYLSTSKASIQTDSNSDGTLDTVINYDPLIKNIGSISNKIDILNKKQRISNYTIVAFNYKYNNERLSDRIFRQSAMNSEINIYFKSQSAQSLSDCLKVYTGYVRNIEESIDEVSIEIEDRTESALTEKIPKRFVDPGLDVPDKYKNKPIPIVYGHVESSPCVYSGLGLEVGDGFVYNTVIADDFYLKNTINIQTYLEELYLEILPTAEWIDNAIAWDGSVYRNLQLQQYIKSDEGAGQDFLFERRLEAHEVGIETALDGLAGTPPAFNFIEVQHTATLIYSGGSYFLNLQDANDNVAGHFAKISQTDTGGTVHNSGSPQIITTFPYYLKPLGMEEIPDDIDDEWFWGPQGDDYVDLGYNNTYGENTISFTTRPFVGEDKTITKIAARPETANDYTSIEYLFVANGVKVLNWDISVQVEKSYGVTQEDPDTIIDDTNGPGDGSIPIFHCLSGEQAAEVWTIADGNYGDDPYYQGNNSYAVDYASDANYNTYRHSSSVFMGPTSNISVNSLQIGQRMKESNGTKLVLNGSRCKLDWIEINNLQLKRNAFLKDFDKLDLYSDVEGRVDDINGRYTGVELTTLSGESDIVIRQEQGISSRRLASASRVKAKGIASKTTKKSTKKIIRGGY